MSWISQTCTTATTAKTGTNLDQHKREFLAVKCTGWTKSRVIGFLQEKHLKGKSTDTAEARYLKQNKNKQTWNVYVCVHYMRSLQLARKKLFCCFTAYVHDSTNLAVYMTVLIRFLQLTVQLAGNSALVKHVLCSYWFHVAPCLTPSYSIARRAVTLFDQKPEI